MSFFKNLFAKSKDTTSASREEEPELEPIVLQAIENLFPSKADQKQAIGYSTRYKKYQKADTLKLLLSLLQYSNGNLEKLLATEKNAIRNYQFMLDEIAPRFPYLKAAEDWVKSLAITQT